MTRPHQQYKRSSDGAQVHGPYNSNKRSSYVELVLVVDNKVFKSLDKNITKVHQHCKDIANIINAVRRTADDDKSQLNICFSHLLFTGLRSAEYFRRALRRRHLVGAEFSRLVDGRRQNASKLS